MCVRGHACACVMFVCVREHVGVFLNGCEYVCVSNLEQLGN